MAEWRLFDLSRTLDNWQRWLSLVLYDPEEALRRMAGPFKRHEPALERAFWASRFRK